MKKKISKSGRVPAVNAAEEPVLPQIHAPESIKDLLRGKWGAALIGLLALAAVFAIRKIANYDIGFHLAAGRWIAENMAVPYTDILTHSVPFNEYIDIQWFYQLINYLTYSVSGYGGLTILNVILISSVFVLTLSRMNASGVHPLFSFVVLLTALLAVQARFSYRPEVFTWLFIILMLIVLDKNLRGNNKALYWLPVIMLFWVNMHGLFVIGIGLLGAYIISGYTHTKSIDKKLLMWGGISIAAVLINPYHINGALFPFYLFTRLQDGNIFQQTIIELHKPWGMITGVETELYIYFAFSIVSFILVLLTLKKRKVHELIILAAFFYLSYSAYRNIPIFILYAAYLAAVCLNELLGKSVNDSGSKTISRYGKIIPISLAVLCFLIGLRVINGAYYLTNSSNIKFGFGIDNTILPEQAAEFINSNGIKGKILNKLEAGGWLEWRLKQPAYIDGRLEVIKEELYYEYRNGLKVKGLAMLIDKYKPDIIISDAGLSAWDSDLKQMGGWRLVHYDYNSTMYVRNGFADNITFDYSSGLQQAGISGLMPKEETNKLITGASLYSFSDWLKGFIAQQTIPTQLIRMGNFTFDNEKTELAETFYAEFIKQSSSMPNKDYYYEVFFNLGSLFHSQGNTSSALICYRNCLKVYPSNQDVLGRITDINKQAK